MPAITIILIVVADIIQLFRETLKSFYYFTTFLANSVSMLIIVFLHPTQDFLHEEYNIFFYLI